MSLHTGPKSEELALYAFVPFGLNKPHLLAAQGVRSKSFETSLLKRLISYDCSLSRGSSLKSKFDQRIKYLPLDFLILLQFLIVNLLLNRASVIKLFKQFVSK